MSDIWTDNFWERTHDKYWGEYVIDCEELGTRPRFKDFVLWCEEAGLVPEVEFSND